MFKMKGFLACFFGIMLITVGWASCVGAIEIDLLEISKKVEVDNAGIEFYDDIHIDAPGIVYYQLSNIGALSLFDEGISSVPLGEVSAVNSLLNGDSDKQTVSAWYDEATVNVATATTFVNIPTATALELGYMKVFANDTATVIVCKTVPVPTTMILLASGLLGLVGFRSKFKR